MRVWIVRDKSYELYSMADASIETAEYIRGAREVSLEELGLTKEEFEEYTQVMDKFMDWQYKLEQKYDEVTSV